MIIKPTCAESKQSILSGSVKKHITDISAKHVKLMNIAIIFLVIMLFSCTKVNTAFYNKVLSDFDSSSYFIALDIKSPSYNGRVLIENNDLFNFLNKKKGISKQKYQSVMEKILVHRRALKVDDKDLLVWKFIKVKYIASVLFKANGGVDNFINYYFNGTLLNYGITDAERNAIINQLFYWEVPAKIDTETGLLLIDNN